MLCVGLRLRECQQVVIGDKREWNVGADVFKEDRRMSVEVKVLYMDDIYWSVGVLNVTVTCL